MKRHQRKLKGDTQGRGNHQKAKNQLLFQGLLQALQFQRQVFMSLQLQLRMLCIQLFMVYVVAENHNQLLVRPSN